MSTTLEQLNTLNKNDFTETIGWVYEHSPWVAARSWDFKPFSSINDLHLKMSTVLQEASPSEQLQIIKVHPKLGARIDMAYASINEQSAVGLGSLSHEEYIEFINLNQNYNEKFEFPFIIAVRGLSKDLIKDAMKKRILLSKEDEKKEAIRQINAIAHYRLSDFIKQN